MTPQLAGLLVGASLAILAGVVLLPRPRRVRLADALRGEDGGLSLVPDPLSIRFGSAKLFQACKSRQFWPESSPMRISVSPGLTV